MCLCAVCTYFQSDYPSFTHGFLPKLMSNLVVMSEPGQFTVFLREFPDFFRAFRE